MENRLVATCKTNALFTLSDIPVDTLITKREGKMTQARESSRKRNK